MTKPIRILLQTTIPYAEDDWHIGRFSLLRDQLASLKDEAGHPLCSVTTRDRESDAAGNDRVLSKLDLSDFDELWLFAIVTGAGLTEADCQGITRFAARRRHHGHTRDHRPRISWHSGASRAHFFIRAILSRTPPRRCRRSVYDFDSGPTTIRAPTATIKRYRPLLDDDLPHERCANPYRRRRDQVPGSPPRGSSRRPEDEEHPRHCYGQSKVTGRPFNLVVA